MSAGPLGVALTAHWLELPALLRLVRRADELGYALAMVDGDPTRELSMLTRPDEGIRLIVQAGRVVKNRLG